jgi:hypothetical protein
MTSYILSANTYQRKDEYDNLRAFKERVIFGALWGTLRHLLTLTFQLKGTRIPRMRELIPRIMGEISWDEIQQQEPASLLPQGALPNVEKTWTA